MERELDKELFVFGLDWVEIFIAHPAVEVAQLREMLTHVGRQHGLNDDLAHALEVSPVHLLMPAATLVFRHQLERGRQVMILQHTAIVVPHRDLVDNAHQEGIVDTRVLEIVQSCADVAAHLLQIVQLNPIFHTPIHRKVVEGLADVGGMRLIVISYSFVACAQFSNEAHQTCEVYVATAYKTMFGENPGQYHDQLVIIRILP